MKYTALLLVFAASLANADEVLLSSDINLILKAPVTRHHVIDVEQSTIKGISPSQKNSRKHCYDIVFNNDDRYVACISAKKNDEGKSSEIVTFETADPIIRD